MAWQRVASASEIGDGRVLGVHVGETPVALYRLSGEIFATASICTHALALLSEGFVEDGQIECPLHQGRFDIRSGKALCAPLTEDIKTYAVKVEGDDVFVDLARPAAAQAAAAPAEATAKPANAVVIIGAGQTAAAAIRAMRASGFNGTIDLVGAETQLPYERPPLSKELLLGKADAAVCRLSHDDVQRLGVRLHLGRRVTAIDVAKRQVAIEDGARLPYDALLVATGGRARPLTVPGAELDGVLHLRTLEDSAAIDHLLAGASHVAIVGGGFTGLELASTALTRGVAVTLLEREREIMGRVMPRPLGRVFRELAQRHGVDIRCGAEVTAIKPHSGGLGVVVGANTIECDGVLVGI